MSNSVAGAIARTALVAICQKSPRADATRETDMHCRATARSLNSTSGRVSRVRRWATRLVSCLHTWRQTMQAKRRTCAWASIHPRSFPDRRDRERRQIRAGEGSLRYVQVSHLGFLSRSHQWGTLALTDRNDAPTRPMQSIDCSCRIIKRKYPYLW